VDTVSRCTHFILHNVYKCYRVQFLAADAVYIEEHTDWCNF